MLSNPAPYEVPVVTERRKGERVKSLLKAKIIFNNRMTSIDCVIKNISAHGARIAIDNSVSLVNEFDLEIPMKGKTYRAVIRWRDGTGMGVEFIDVPQESDHTPPRMQKLEAENARLKTLVASLTKRLEDLGQDVSTSMFF